MRLCTSWHLAAVVAILLPTAGPAQEQAPLILEERQPQVEVRRVPRATPAPESSEAEVPPAPTPDPKTIVVAIVNSRALTRAHIDARVGRRFEAIKAEVQRQHGGIVGMIGAGSGSFSLDQMDLDDKLLLEEQKRQVEDALLVAEEEAMQEWVSHGMLADEARRQGIIVTEQEFRLRLEEAERESQLARTQVDDALRDMSMTRAEYERSVYDALMIEKLLTRFIEINYDEQYLRERFEENPILYFEPEKHLLAHFAISFDGGESRDHVRKMRALAEEVRARFRAGEEPEKVFAEEKYLRIDQGIWGQLPSWYHLGSGNLPPQVESDAAKLKMGQVSGVIEQQRRLGGQIVISSLHVLKMMDYEPAKGDTFETARPVIHRAMLELARIHLTERLRTSGHHRIITNLGGIPPRIIPTREELAEFERNAEPINLMLPTGRRELSSR